MEKVMSPNQSKALLAWGWILWIGCAYWLARSPWSDNAEFHLTFFAFLVLMPKAIRGFFYHITPHQNRFSEGYTDKDKRLLLYLILFIVLGLWMASQVILNW